MNTLGNIFRTTRLSIWLLVCALILAATSVYAAGDQRPLAAVDILGSPDAAVDGKFAVGTDTPGNKALTVAGVIDFVGAGTVHNYFTQGPGNNMQIRSNVDEYNAVGNSSYAQWNMVMGASLDVFSIRRSPAGSTYNEDALFWIEGDTGKIGIATVDTSNGATIPYFLDARLSVATASEDAIWGISYDTSDNAHGVYGMSISSTGYGVFGYNAATSGDANGVYGWSDSTEGTAIIGYASATTGYTIGVYAATLSPGGHAVYGVAASSTGHTNGVFGESDSTDGRGVYGGAYATSGTTYGVYGKSSSSTYGHGVYGYASSTIGSNIGVMGKADSTQSTGVYGWASATSGYTRGVYGISDSTDGDGVYGRADATSGTTYGVRGRSYSTSGTGVYGFTTATNGTTYGVYGSSNSTAGYDFYAGGDGTDYGPFTGAHEVRLSESFPQEIQAGMIVSATGKAHIRHTGDGSVDISSTLPTVKLADTAEDKAVFGVLVAEVTLPEDHWYEAEEDERFASVNALGEGRVWVTNVNGDIEAGDYITTSIVPGYGQRQDDCQLNNYTLGKATETVDWNTVTETVVFNGKEFKVYLLAVVYTSG